jgi:hypothetical protein
MKQIHIFLALLLSAMIWTAEAKAAIGFRSKTFVTSSSATSATPTEPVGAAQNDILLMFIVIETSNTTFIAPAGWTQLYALPSTTGADVWVYWIRRGASAPSYGISWTNLDYYEVSVTAWSGVITSGNPYDAIANNARAQANPSAPDCPAVTTTVANTVVLALGMTWAGWGTGGAGTPTGYTLRESGGYTVDLGVASKLVVVAGTDDPSIYTNVPANLADKAEITIALKPQVPPLPIRHRVRNE